MCFHGRRKNLLAADSAAGIGAESVEDEVDIEDMRCSKNRNRNQCLQLSRSLPDRTRKSRIAIPFGGGRARHFGALLLKYSGAPALSQIKCFTKTRVPEYYA
jgi:hypothetical protein